VGQFVVRASRLHRCRRDARTTTQQTDPLPEFLRIRLRL